EALLDRTDTSFDLAHTDLNAFEPAIEPSAEVANLVEDRSLCSPDPATHLVTQVIDPTVLRLQVRGNACTELANHRLEVILGHDPPPYPLQRLCTYRSISSSSSTACVLLFRRTKNTRLPFSAPGSSAHTGCPLGATCTRHTS